MPDGPVADNLHKSVTLQPAALISPLASRPRVRLRGSASCKRTSMLPYRFVTGLTKALQPQQGAGQSQTPCRNQATSGSEASGTETGLAAGAAPVRVGSVWVTPPAASMPLSEPPFIPSSVMRLSISGPPTR